jgi:hypothetical protein
LAINTTTVTTAANWIPEIWASQLADATEANIQLAGLVDRSFEDQLRMGDQINIPTAHNPAVRVKLADTSGTYSNITENIQNLQITRQAYVGFLVEDITEIQSTYATRATYTEKASYSLMAYVEGDITSGLTSLPDDFSQSVGTLGVDPTTDNIIRAKQYLDDGDVPESDRFFYMSPATHAALLKQEAFSSQLYVGQDNANAAQLRGEIPGSVYGARTVVSSLANANPAASGQSYSWFCHKKGVALVMQRSPAVHTQYEVLELGWGVVVDVIYNFIERLLPTSGLGLNTQDDRFNVSIAGP